MSEIDDFERVLRRGKEMYRTYYTNGYRVVIDVNTMQWGRGARVLNV